MNSCLYKATIMHHRTAPVKHVFNYKIFMFYLDLDEIDLISKKFFMISRNKFNFFSFKDSEHLQLPAGNPDKNLSTREHIVRYLKENGYQYTNERIMLLTNLNILGYNFNPVSFYFVIDGKGQPKCAISEVGNTFREIKPYFLPGNTLEQETFKLITPKYFYVSPFIDHDSSFDFSLAPPGEQLSIRIDDRKNGERFFISTLTGKRTSLNASNLLWYTFRFPFLTLRIISLIHWHALLLWLKKLPYHKKAHNIDLQRDVYRKYEQKSATADLSQKIT